MSDRLSRLSTSRALDSARRVSAFLTLGYFLGDRWETVSRDIHHYILTLAIALAIMLAAYLVLRKRRQAAGRKRSHGP